MRLRLGTRGSRLAWRQAEWVHARLEQAGLAVELVEITTTGDELADIPLRALDTADVFTRQIDQALLAGEIDLAVHSLKDLPVILPDGVTLAAVSIREDPRDAIIGRGPVSLSELPPGAVVATCSLRRRAQLLHARPDLTLADLRGNIDTRIAKLDANGGWSGIILAVAGLNRLGLAGRIGEYLEPGVMLPAPGQGALAVTTRVDPGFDDAIRGGLHHEATALCCAAERAVLQFLACGCHAPVAALARLDETGSMTLDARVLSIDGTQQVEVSLTLPVSSGPEAVELGNSAAGQLLQRGADSLLVTGART
jgi:hydroxymethylbilane synthase